MGKEKPKWLGVVGAANRETKTIGLIRLSSMATRRTHPNIHVGTLNKVPLLVPPRDQQKIEHRDRLISWGRHQGGLALSKNRSTRSFPTTHHDKVLRDEVLAVVMCV